MRIEKKATIISTTVALILVIAKMAAAIFSGSVAILASAIDSLLDLTISLFNYFALHNAERDPDDTFNFGRSKLEPLAAVIEGVIISMSALFILYEAISKLIHPQHMEAITAGIYIMLFSISLTTILVLFLRQVAKQTGNMVIKADALHYQTDILSNLAVLVSLGIVAFTSVSAVDAFFGIGIGIYMIYSAYPIIKEGIFMLLDGAASEDEIAKIIQAIKEQPECKDFHHLKTRVSGSHIFISVHIVFSISTSLYDAHLASDKLELKLKKLFEDKKIHTIVHMDPYDDSDINDTED